MNIVKRVLRRLKNPLTSPRHPTLREQYEHQELIRHANEVRERFEREMRETERALERMRHEPVDR